VVRVASQLASRTNASWLADPASAVYASSSSSNPPRAGAIRRQVEIAHDGVTDPLRYQRSAAARLPGRAGGADQVHQVGVFGLARVEAGPAGPEELPDLGADLLAGVSGSSPAAIAAGLRPASTVGPPSVTPLTGTSTAWSTTPAASRPASSSR
jgi:hypothetical protein